jgi:hypothetical protein
MFCENAGGVAVLSKHYPTREPRYARTDNCNSFCHITMM